MSTTVDAIKNEVNAWASEEAKHASGNKSAGTRAPGRARRCPS